MTTIEIAGQTATLNGATWRCDDTVIENALQVAMFDYGPWGGDPSPEYNRARRIVEKFGGRITSPKPLSVKSPADTIF